MNWIGLCVFLAAITVLLLLKRAGQISLQAARELLNNGAVVVDVRTPSEFASGHLPGAINIPLSDVAKMIPGRFPDRRNAILLHCASGARSEVAKRKLKTLGYTNAFNLGSYARAKQVIARG
jgi:phage shock protein E